mgnify:CR=1 FL=1
MGVGIALAAGVAAGWFKVNGWLIFMLVVISAGIGVIGYIKTYWTDRTCKYLIGLSVFFVVGFCRGSVCFEENETFLNENFAFENKEIQDEFKKCNVYARPECRDCWARLYCSGGCAANAYHATGKITGIYEYGCKLFKKRMECAIAVAVARMLGNK